MTIRDLQRMARRFGIKTGGLSKFDLIRAIQRAEGNFACFGTATGFCDQSNCLFREECLDL
jgi:hypothetical protein